MYYWCRCRRSSIEDAIRTAFERVLLWLSQHKIDWRLCGCMEISGRRRPKNSLDETWFLWGRVADRTTVKALSDVRRRSALNYGKEEWRKHEKGWARCPTHISIHIHSLYVGISKGKLPVRRKKQKKNRLIEKVGDRKGHSFIHTTLLLLSFFFLLVIRFALRLCTQKDQRRPTSQRRPLSWVSHMQYTVVRISGNRVHVYVCMHAWT